MPEITITPLELGNMDTNPPFIKLVRGSGSNVLLSVKDNGGELAVVTLEPATRRSLIAALQTYDNQGA